MARRLLLFGLIVIALVAIAALTLPWWWGGALRVVGQRHGLSFASYEQNGYTRWVLRDVVWARGGTTVRAARVEAGHPLGWALGWGRQRGVHLENWSVDVQPTEKKPRSGARGWRPTYARSHRIEQQLARWLPVATAEHGVVRWPGQSLTIARAAWAEETLHVDDLEFRQRIIDVDARWGPGASPLHVHARMGEHWNLEVTANAETVTAEFGWQDEQALAKANFAVEGWTPDSAELEAREWQLPPSWLKLADHYANVTATAMAQWDGASGRIQIDATGDPLEGANVPPLRANGEVVGTPTILEIRALDLDAPGLRAQLDQPVRIERGQTWSASPALFRVNANLAELPGIDASGTASGQVRVIPRTAERPLIEAALSVADASMGEWVGWNFQADAQLDWPRLVISQATANDAQESHLQASGEIDLRQRTLAIATDARIVAASLAPLALAAVQFNSIELKASAEGPFRGLAHTGQATIEAIETPRTHPARVELAWSGHGPAASGEMLARSRESTLQLRFDANADRVRLEHWEVQQAGQTAFRLIAPSEVHWTKPWRIEPVHLQGDALEVRVEADWRGEGTFSLDAPLVTVDWLSDWLIPSVPLTLASGVLVKGAVEQGTLRFESRGDFEFDLPQTPNARIRLAATGDATGVRIERLHAGIADQTVFTLSGQIPVVFRPRDEVRFHPDPNGQLGLSGRVESIPTFWQEVAQRTGVRVVDPEITLEARGTWLAPVGTLRVSAEQVALGTTGPRSSLPTIADLILEVGADGESVRLERLTANVEGQQILAQAEVPLRRSDWAVLRDDPIAYLRQHLSGEAEIPEADLAVLARFVPTFLAPAGQLSTRLEVRPGGQLSGFVRVRNAISRPLGPLGVLQEITADLDFAGREVLLKRVAARMGGQPVMLSGSAALTDDLEPKLKLRLTGENLPLVRQTGVLLRGDLDLAVTTEDAARGRVSGAVRLRDGLFLADLQDVVPRGSGVSRPRARPPYFSVTIEPLEQWLLDVSVSGTDFLRLRTPVLESTASARFQLTGTLGEPRATGEAVLEGGVVRLPFATFSIESGEVRITQANPFEPQLSLTGTSRRLGYDLRMELAGTASDPRLQFFSSPPLPSEDILLLVMAGQAPQEEVTYTGSQRAMQIGTFLGRGVISDIFGGGGGDRLTITTGERISRQGRETYRFAYELNPRLSLVGEYDEFDSYNAGLRWRLVPGREEKAAREAGAQPEQEGDENAAE